MSISVDIYPVVKVCLGCGKKKLAVAFSPDKRKPGRRHARCRKCAAEKRRAARAKTGTRGSMLMTKFGLSLGDYEVMLEAQDGVCAICGEPERMKRNGVVRHLCVDHDHETGEVRGLLCAACNKAIGLMRDDTERLMAAIEYIDDYSGDK